MKTRELTVGEFKARFSESLERVAQGETILVTYGRNKRPVAAFGPPPAPPRRKLGHLAGKFHVTIDPHWDMTDEEFLNS